MTSLSRDERVLLEDCEGVIRVGAAVVESVESAWLTIYTRKLWREYPSFALYLQGRHKWTKSRAYYQQRYLRMVVAGMVKSPPNGKMVDLPQNERQARAIARYPEPIRQQALRETRPEEMTSRQLGERARDILLKLSPEDQAEYIGAVDREKIDQARQRAVAEDREQLEGRIERALGKAVKAARQLAWSRKRLMLALGEAWG